jgi:hypothetical protein
MIRATSRRPPTAEDRVQFQASPCRICGHWNRFLSVHFSFFLSVSLHHISKLIHLTISHRRCNITSSSDNVVKQYLECSVTIPFYGVKGLSIPEQIQRSFFSDVLSRTITTSRDEDMSEEVFKRTEF